MEADHRRLEAMLEAATAASAIDHAAYAAFRGMLLKHIAMEERVIFPAARKTGVRTDALARLRADHGRLAALMVPSPTQDLARQVRALLVEHDAVEEGDDGVYAACEAVLTPSETDEILRRLHAMPEVRVARHLDLPR
jgi:hypothetical protein